MSDAQTYRIETQRLVIRCYQPSDAPVLKAAIDESLEHLKPWMPWAKYEPESLEAKTERVTKFHDEFVSGIDYVFGIFDKTETFLIGSTGLHTRAGEGAREIGYWIHVDHIGNGYATETVKALTKVGFEIEGLERIEIRCDPRNEKSLKIPKKLGYQLREIIGNFSTDVEGNLRDIMVWEMKKEEYLNKPVDMPLKAFDAAGKESIFNVSLDFLKITRIFDK